LLVAAWPGYPVWLLPFWPVWDADLLDAKSGHKEKLDSVIAQRSIDEGPIDKAPEDSSLTCNGIHLHDKDFQTNYVAQEAILFQKNLPAPYPNQ